MIECKFYFTCEKFIKAFIIKGHADFMSEGILCVKGKDILCAGVSCLAQGIVTGLKYAANADIVINSKENGHLDISVREPDDAAVFVLLKTLYISLKELEKDFPNNIRIEEVL